MLILAQAAESAANSAAFGELAPPLQIAIFLGALSFIAALLVCVTAFTRIIIVLSFVRRALATQEIPPNPVLLGLSLFLTLFVMAPTFDAIHEKAIGPLLEQQKNSEAGKEAENKAGKEADNEADDKEHLTYEQAWNLAAAELKKFMLANTRTDDLQLFFDLANSEPIYDQMDAPLKIVVPAFIISELKTAFIMGFCIYIPFLLIDLVVSTILMSLGMMMMPPVVVSTPCKILLFVLVDGWQLITKALVSSFAGI